MYHDEQPSCVREPQRHKPLVIWSRMQCVGNGKRKWIGENGRCFLKCDVVLARIQVGFHRVPLEDYSHAASVAAMILGMPFAAW